MASTYSPTLRLELIGTGEQSGLWGDTTNTNLGALIEQAITGVESIPMLDANYTLTALNGSVDEARNAVLIFTSGIALTATRDVIIPNVEKIYIVKNSTTGGQNLVVKTSGGAGYTVPNGQTVSLYCDGTDCHPVITTLSSPALTGTPTAPTAAYGTNTTQIATTAFVQQAGLTGEIKMWGTASAPTGYLMCNGQTVSRSTYSGLFAIIGTTFGSGDGSTTFTLPNYTDRMPVGAGSAYALAATGGSANATLVSHSHTYSGTTSAGGSHSHSISDPGHSHGYYRTYANAGSKFTDHSGQDEWEGWVWEGTGSAYTGVSVNGVGDHTHGFSGSTSTDGSSATNANLPPYLGVYFIIKY